MRVHLNRSLKTKPKKQDDASRHNKEKKTNKETKNTMEPDNTELITQITFAAAMVAANLLTFYALHIAALIILFKCITNFPKERNQKNTRGRHPPYSKTTKSERRMRNWNCSAITGNQSRPEVPHIMKPKPNPEIRLPKI